MKLTEYFRPLAIAALSLSVLGASSVLASDDDHCDSGPRSDWVSVDELKAHLTEQGWRVRRVEEDDGCFEVYAIDNEGRRVEAYVHPITLKLKKLEWE